MRVPSKMKVGDVFGDLRIDLGLVKVSITNRQLDAIESVTVPAGTFKDAYKMTYKMNVGNSTSTVTEWYARGVGIVKSVSVDGKGNPESSAELVRMGQGDGKLVIDVTPEDGGTVHSDPNQTVYPAGANVTLIAEAALGYKFKKWTGAATGTRKGSSAAVVGKTEVTAVFEKAEDLDMVYVQGGTFMMGCTDEQTYCKDNEKPVHSVTVSDFNIGKYEVTQRLWEQVMGANSSDSKGVDGAGWNEVQEFIKRLNQQTGKTYRLPTEAEWEYAARGGNKSKGYKYAGSNKIDEVAWHGGNSYGRRQSVGSVGTYQPNELGIHDMSGNVWEWVNDWYGEYTSGSETDPQGPSSGSYRVIRGGSWDRDARDCRVSFRGMTTPDVSRQDLGFRLVLSP
jgi:formylglycine-generating enzyme required for sulfatase activity